MSEDNPRPRVIFDCMIYLQSIVSETGPAAALLRLIDNDSAEAIPGLSNGKR